MSTRRAYVFVGDVCEALVALADLDRAHASVVCNVSTERRYDGYEVIAAIGRAMGRQTRLEMDPRRLRASERPGLLSNRAWAHEILGCRARTTLDLDLRRTAARRMASGIEFV